MDSVKIQSFLKPTFIMKDGLKDSAPPFSNVYKWVREFKYGPTSVKDASRSG